MNLIAVESVPSAFPLHILHVFSLCTYLQMLGIEALGIVTLVQHHVTVKITVVLYPVQFGTQPMHQPHTTLMCADSIALCVYGLPP